MSWYNLIRCCSAACFALGFTGACWALIPPGLYVQMQGGVGGIDTRNYPENSDPYDNVVLTDGISYRLSAGYISMHQSFNYGFELGYAGYPNNTYSFSFPTLPAEGVQQYQGYVIDCLGVLKLDLNSVLNHDIYLLGKTGVARVSQTFNGRSAALNTVFTFNKTVNQFEPEVVGGIGYSVNKNFDINLNYHQIFAGSADPVANPVDNSNKLTQISSVHLLMAGVTYYFL